MKKYLVTGGCGFIGSHLADALVARGDSVVILDNLSSGKRENANEHCEVIINDVNDQKVVRSLAREVDGIFHMAAIASVELSNEAWVDTHKTNLTGLINILDAVKELKYKKLIPVVYASSAAIYGDNASIPLSESAHPRPLTAYGADKFGCEMHARIASLVHAIPTMGFRFFNVYGPRQDPLSPYSGVISIFLNNFINNHPLSVFGDGDQVRDFIYVDDVVKFLLAGMENVGMQHEIYNVCTGKATSIRQLISTMSAILNKTVNVVFEPQRVGDIQCSIGDPDKSAKSLGMCADTELGEGLQRLIMTILNR